MEELGRAAPGALLLGQTRMGDTQSSSPSPPSYWGSRDGGLVEATSAARQPPGGTRLPLTPSVSIPSFSPSSPASSLGYELGVSEGW